MKGWTTLFVCKANWNAVRVHAHRSTTPFLTRHVLQPSFHSMQSAGIVRALVVVGLQRHGAFNKQRVAVNLTSFYPSAATPRVIPQYRSGELTESRNVRTVRFVFAAYFTCRLVWPVCGACVCVVAVPGRVLCVCGCLHKGVGGSGVVGGSTFSELNPRGRRLPAPFAAHPPQPHGGGVRVANNADGIKAPCPPRHG